MNAEAMKIAEEILDFLVQQNLDSAREPMLIYWNCYQVLRKNSDPRARPLLTAAYQLLLDQAAKLGNGQRQHAYLTNIDTHQKLCQEYQHLLGR